MTQPKISKIRTRLRTIRRLFTTNQKFTLIKRSFSLAMALIYCGTKVIPGAPMEALIFFIFLGAMALVYSVLIVYILSQK